MAPGPNIHLGLPDVIRHHKPYPSPTPALVLEKKQIQDVANGEYSTENQISEDAYRAATDGSVAEDAQLNGSQGVTNRGYSTKHQTTNKTRNVIKCPPGCPCHDTTPKPPHERFARAIEKMSRRGKKKFAFMSDKRKRELEKQADVLWEIYGGAYDEGAKADGDDEDPLGVGKVDAAAGLLFLRHGNSWGKEELNGRGGESTQK
jgi:hypothetical protein